MLTYYGWHIMFGYCKNALFHTYWRYELITENNIYSPFHLQWNFSGAANIFMITKLQDNQTWDILQVIDEDK